VDSGPEDGASARGMAHTNLLATSLY
jgi:hypothetical protein